MLGDTDMSRRGRRDRSSTPIADAVFDTPLTNRLLSYTPSPQGPLIDVEDRRTWHPEDFFRPAMEIGGTRTTQRVVKKSFKPQLPFGLQFAVPEKTAICVRRKTRKEVLHAMRKTGGGQRRRNKPTKNWYSKLGC